MGGNVGGVNPFDPEQMKQDLLNKYKNPQGQQNIGELQNLLKGRSLWTQGAPGISGGSAGASIFNAPRPNQNNV